MRNSAPGYTHVSVCEPQALAELNSRPIIMPLSNPTSHAECTFQEAVTATGGRLLFASGSPFDPIQWQGKTRLATQSNNACAPSNSDFHTVPQTLFDRSTVRVIQPPLSSADVARPSLTFPDIGLDPHVT